MARNVFYNPPNADTYNWHVNHSDEDSFGRERSIDHTAKTGGVGVVRQQGPDGPMVLKLKGTILHALQHKRMWQFFGYSRTNSIRFTDFAGNVYDVIVVAFNPVRQRTMKNPRDSSIPLHYWTYTIDMEVLTFVDGAEADAGLIP